MRSKDGAVVRVFTSHQCGPVSIPAQHHIWVEFKINVRSRLAPRFFYGLSSFPQKATFPNFNSTRTEDLHENQPRLMWVPL